MENQKQNTLLISVVDDHKLFRHGLVKLIQSFEDSYKVISESSNGKEFLDFLSTHQAPDIVIMDINMPVMDGFETMEVLRKKYPDLKVLALTMLQDEQTLIRMLRYGIRGYLGKDVEPEELKQAFSTISQKGYYYNDYLTGRLVHNLQDNPAKLALPALNERESHFLKLACSELTYKEIADKMHLSIKTIDGYRNALFEKLDVKSRVGLVLYAIKNKLVELNS